MPFQPAVKYGSKLRLAIQGPAGAGKTFTALKLARLMFPEGRIAVIDTEHGSAAKYADLWAFDISTLDFYSPENYIAEIHAAEKAGYDILIIDSLSHALSLIHISEPTRPY